MDIPILCDTVTAEYSWLFNIVWRIFYGSLHILAVLPTRACTKVLYKETFIGENFHEFHNFRATYESFFHEILGMPYISTYIYDWFSILQNAFFLTIHESFLP